MKYADSVKDTSATTGTGTLTLDGATLLGARSFATAVTEGDLTNGDTVGYRAQMGAEWEVGSGVYSSGTLTRVTVYASSNSGAAVSFSAGTKVVSLCQVAAEILAVGKTYLGYIAAGGIKPSTTSGCAALAWSESTTNDVMVGSLAFDAAAIEYAQFSFKAPALLNEASGFTAIFEWTEAASATTHDVVWQIEMQAQGDGDTIDSAWGTAVTVTDTGTSGTRRFTAETSTITPGGTWAAGDEIIVRVSRKATDGSDTLNVDALLIGVSLYATQSSLMEA